jgi:phytoene/squalene synthetase
MQNSGDNSINEERASMTTATAVLAQSITWMNSKQSYYTAHLLVDKDLVQDCFRAYAYFRWADDFIDLSSQSREECISFIKRQKELIQRLYKHERPDDLSPEEEMIADLIRHDRAENSGLQSFILNFLAILEFDTQRKGRLITQSELTWYSNCLAKSVTDAIQYFIRNGHPYPDCENRYLAATAAHVTHMLRDMSLDIAEGYINIPSEYLEAHSIGPEDMESSLFRAWVQERVELAREYFCEGKRYLDELEVLRCKIAGHWYCARFESVLDTIERDGYILRTEYNERSKLSTWLKMVWLTISLSIQHIARRDHRGVTDNLNLGTDGTKQKGYIIMQRRN